MTAYCGKPIATVVLSNLPTVLREQFEIDIFQTGWDDRRKKFHCKISF